MTLLASDERLARRVGAATLVALAAAIGFVVFLLDRIEIGSYVRIHVYFHHTGGLREGAAFVVAGQAIGRIESVAPSPRGADTPLHGDEGVDVTVAIARRRAEGLRHGADVFVASRGALSERYLEIGPTPDVGEPLVDGKPILGRDPPSLDRVLQRTWDNLQTFGGFLDEVRPEGAAFRAELATLARTLADVMPEQASTLATDVDALVAEAKQLFDTGLGGSAGLDRIRALVKHARGTLAEARGMLDGLATRADALTASVETASARLGAKGPVAMRAIELAIDRTRAAIDKIDPLLAKLDELSDRIARGEGSLGRLARDPEFPEDAKELGKILKRQPWKVISHPQD